MMRICSLVVGPLLLGLALPLAAAERLDPQQLFLQLRPDLGHLQFLWTQAEGDLNGDGMADVAMLLTGSTGTDAGRDERLVILAGTPAGGYRVLSVSADFCHPSKFYNLEIRRGALLVETVETADGGRWGSTTRRFRYNAGRQDLELIGEDTRSEDESSGEAERGSTNFLTGQHVSTTRSKGKTKTTTRQLGITARPFLNGWDCGR